MARLIFLALGLLLAQAALGVPEVARYGHGSCTSCHISPGGSAALTNYGRIFAAEKLSTWAYLDEEYLLHGLVKPSENLLVGGDARWVYSSRQIEGARQDNFWRMQTDIQPVLKIKDVWAEAVFGTKPAGPMDRSKSSEEVVTRGYSLRFDLIDQHLLARVGLFMPKFGLMSADHTMFTRQAAGQGPESEISQIEFTFQDDEVEVTAALFSEKIAQHRKEQPQRGLNFSVSKLILQKNRVTLGLLRTEMKHLSLTRADTSGVVSSVLTFTAKMFSMIELTRVNNRVLLGDERIISDSMAGFLTLNYELFRGFSPFTRVEFLDQDFARNGNKTNRYGLGFVWYPRPHLQAEFRALEKKSSLNNSRSSISSDLILHYYF